MNKVQRFNKNISHLELPQKFTFPFYYEPHELAIEAVKQLQEYLEQVDLNHNFGIDDVKKGLIIGKMFGVLVVKDINDELGFIAAFSGKLANENHHDYFVPPIYDLLNDKGFFIKDEEIINQINHKIEIIENSSELKAIEKEFTILLESNKQELQDIKQKHKANKKYRDTLRKQLENEEINFNSLRAQSISDSYELKRVLKKHKDEIQSLEEKKNIFISQLETLKEERKKKSSELQQRIFNEYKFLNADKTESSLLEIFVDKLNIQPPAGAGECAAPKLLQFAYENNLKPIALAEFWWGKSPSSEIRIHKNFYPACKSKCEPILTHMLKGLEVDENPLLTQKGADFDNLEIIFEDEYMLAVNKPEEFLSVPGINIKDSIYERVKLKYPRATGPLIVHRLDMSTSGILLLAKDKETYLKLQKQFIKKTIRKRYVALLDGIIENKNGEINLPLRVDLDDRPRQVVCYEHGKTALTKYEIISIENGKTRVFFYPITGRTHQLRVHAAHHSGLNTPILGDDLYGKKDNRLHLHAESITFKHPISNEEITLQINPNF